MINENVSLKMVKMLNIFKSSTDVFYNICWVAILRESFPKSTS